MFLSSWRGSLALVASAALAVGGCGRVERFNVDNARAHVERLDRGEPLPTVQPYPVQTWCFGDDLAMVFLGGEVVVDYALRLKRELDPSRLWVAAYCNDVPCYIASKRVLREGGYEADDSMIYYDRPTRFAPEVEDRIVATVRDLLPKSFAPAAR